MPFVGLFCRKVINDQVMTTEKIGTRQFWMLFLTTSALLVSYALFEGRVFIFGPAVLETGDFAANGLQIFDAGHFEDLLGNYSRWGFNHPGPFFFYLYSLGERLFFDLLKLTSSPHQAHVIAGTIFQSACIAFSICLFASLTGRRLILYIGLACAAFILPRTLGALSSIWPPHVLLGPYILLIVSCAAVSLGRRHMLPVAVFAACVLCHGHVAQPLMTLPLLSMAIALHLWNARSRGEPVSGAIRELQVQIWVSLSIAVIFLAPLLIDLSRCPDCNAHRIMEYMRDNHDRRPRFGQAINYVFSFIRFEHFPEWLDGQRSIHVLTRRVKLGLALTCLLLVLPRLLKKWIAPPAYQAVSTLALFAVAALVLSIIWTKRITGSLFEFNSFFIYGIMFVGACTVAATLSLLIRNGRQTAMASALVSIATIAIAMRGPGLPVFSSPYVLQLPNEANNSSVEPPVTVLINQIASKDWPATITLALWLTRHDVNFMVPPQWAYVFGWRHSLEADRALLAGNRIEIWEPSSKDVAMLTKRIFEPSTFCHISESSPIPTITASPMSLDDLRSKCEIAAIGLEKAGAWTSGHYVALQFVGRHAEHPVRLNFDVYPFLVRDKLAVQAVRAYVNGSEIGDAELTSERVVSFSAPSAVWNASKVVTVALILPDAASPKSLGMSREPRIIGLGFKGMGIQYDNADLEADQQIFPPPDH